MWTWGGLLRSFQARIDLKTKFEESQCVTWHLENQKYGFKFQQLHPNHASAIQENFETVFYSPPRCLGRGGGSQARGGGETTLKILGSKEGDPKH